MVTSPIVLSACLFLFVLPGKQLQLVTGLSLERSLNSTSSINTTSTASTSNDTTSSPASSSLINTITTSSTSAVSSILYTTSIAAVSRAGSEGDDATSTSSSTPSSTSSNICNYCTVPDGYTSPQVEAPLPPLKGPIPRSWREAHAKAKAFLEGWTVEEKVMLATGVGWAVGRCVGNTPDIPSRNWTGLCLEDSPLGVRFADFASAFPAGINVASTFDKELMYDRGKAMGKEFRGKGVNVALGPMTNMGRVAAGGRNWEGFGADPYLSGWATYQTIKGIQHAGVQATVKHYVGNEQERARTTESSNIDDRTLREIYTHPFLRAVQADVAAVMCSYNLINGSWACQNSKTLNGILKTDFGFQGYVMSDWDATHSGVLSANSGLDMNMPGDIGYNGGLTSYWGSNLTDSVNNGSVSLARLNDMTQRIVASWFLVGQDDPDYPNVNFDAFDNGSPNNEHVNVQDDHWKLIQHIGAASTVLLKNTNNTLPLDKPRSIALIGSDVGPSLQGPNGYSDRGGDDGTLAMGWGSGTANYPYLVDPLQAISHRARHDGTSLSWWLLDWNTAGAATTAMGVDVAIVGINSDSGEAYITVDGNEGDRNNLTAWHNGDELVLAVAAVNNNTIVVVHSVGPLIVEAWIDHPNVTAVLWAGIPGQESGNALVDVLYGAYNPSGRLPYTIARNRSDYSADIDYVGSDVVEPQVNYTEGLFIDYRHFLAQNITPRYPFGYGESYTTFEYTNLDIVECGTKQHGGDFVWGRSKSNKTAVGSFLSESLHAARWTVSVEIENVGDVNGCEVPQLYLSFPDAAGEPPKVLRDFSRINLDPGVSQTVSFNLSLYDVSIWDVISQDWTVPNGTFGITVARHSFDDDGVYATFCPACQGNGH